MADNPKEKEFEYYISSALRAATEAKKFIRIDENAHQTIAGYAHPDPREYILYSALNEIEKVGVILINYKEFFQNLGDQAVSDRADYLILNAVNEDLTLWLRKMSEILLVLIGFRQTNNIEVYRHYLLVEKREKLQKRVADLETYYVCRNKNLEYQILQLEEEIKQQELKHAITNNWYFMRNSSGNIHTYSHEDKLKTLIKLATDAQKVALGLSYERYRLLSGKIHVNSDPLDRFIKIAELEHSFAYIGLLCMHSLVIIKDLLHKRPRKGKLAELNRIIKRNKLPTQLLRGIKYPEIEKGDFIVVNSDLAEVVMIKRGPFGYKTYRVRYLSTPPIPSILEDEFPYYHIELYKKKSEIRDEVVKNIAPKGTRKVNYKVVSDSIKETIIDFWENLGGKEYYQGQRDAAYKKLIDSSY